MTARRPRWIAGTVLTWIVLAASAAQAAGFGAYFEYGRGIAQQESGLGFDLDFTENKYGVGLALDTAVAQNRLFNYRLNLGYQYSSREFDLGGLVGNADLNGFSLNQMFGFGVLRTRNLRLWLGPSLRLNFDFVDEDIPRANWLDLGMGVGIAAGLNLHTGSVGSAAFTLGYQYLYVGEFVYGDAVNTDVFNGGEHLISFNLSYFFRSRGDRFAPRPRRRAAARGPADALPDALRWAGRR
jgi:hypothetical protein